MSDLISRQAAIEAIVNAVSRIGLHDNSEVARYGATFRQQEILDIIDALPSAEPEIIRCKDCKHRYVKDMIWHCPFGLMGGENFFCGYGSLGTTERRTDG